MQSTGIPIHPRRMRETRTGKRKWSIAGLIGRPINSPVRNHSPPAARRCALDWRCRSMVRHSLLRYGWRPALSMLFEGLLKVWHVSIVTPLVYPVVVGVECHMSLPTPHDPIPVARSPGTKRPWSPPSCPRKTCTPRCPTRCKGRRRRMAISMARPHEFPPHTARSQIGASCSGISPRGSRYEGERDGDGI